MRKPTDGEGEQQANWGCVSRQTPCASSCRPAGATPRRTNWFCKVHQQARQLRSPLTLQGAPHLFSVQHSVTLEAYQQLPTYRKPGQLLTLQGAAHLFRVKHGIAQEAQQRQVLVVGQFIHWVVGQHHRCHNGRLVRPPVCSGEGEGGRAH